MSPSRFTAWSVIGGVALSPAIICCGAAAWFLWAGYTAGPLTVVDVAALPQGSFSGRYVELTGWARPGLTVAIDALRFKGSPTTYGFFPLFADVARLDATSPVVIKAFLDDAEPLLGNARDGRAIRVRGVLHVGVASYARDPLEQRGVLLASGAITLDATESPADDIQFGWMIGVAGLIVQSIVLGLMWWLSRD